MKTMQDWEIISLDTTMLRAHGTDKCYLSICSFSTFIKP